MNVSFLNATQSDPYPVNQPVNVWIYNSGTRADGKYLTVEDAALHGEKIDSALADQLVVNDLLYKLIERLEERIIVLEGQVTLDIGSKENDG